MIKKFILVLLVLSISILGIACNDDEENPQAAGVNPSASALSATVATNSVSLSWTECPDDDFASYDLYRSETSGIAADPASATMVTTITDVQTLTYTDLNLAWETTYFYALKTVDSSQLTSWSNEVSITTPDSSGGGGGSALTCYEIQGQADASPYDGEDVTVTGIVTVGGTELYAGTGTAQYAAIEDATGGEWSGVILYGYDGILTGLVRGDSVVVSGYVSEYNGLTEIVVNAVDFDDPSHSVPSPASISTDDVDLEKWEGVLVSVTNVTVTDDDLGYGEWAVSDGSGDARIDDMGDISYSPSNGDIFSKIIGVAFYSFDNYKIEPRDDSDLIQ